MDREGGAFPLSEDIRPCLHVCVTCKAPGDPEPGPHPAGRQLYEAVCAALDARPDGAAAATVEPVVCFANCERGCTAALSQPGKWAYMVGGLTPDHAEDLVTYAAAYARSDNGTVWRSGRPESLHHAIVARFPAPGGPAPAKDAAE